MTAEFLLHRVARVKEGDVVLVHAAAGGTGQLLCQWARALGATVIGTVGSRDKAPIAREAGCEHPIVYTEERLRRALSRHHRRARRGRRLRCRRPRHASAIL